MLPPLPRFIAAAVLLAAAGLMPPDLSAQERPPMDGTMTMIAQSDRDEMLMNAIADGEEAKVELLLDLYRREGHAWPLHRYDGSLLHIAAGGTSVPVLQTLLAAGFSPRLLGPGSRTPLHHAAFNNRPRMVMLLLAAGAEIDARTAHALMPLHLSVGSTTQLLLDAGADPAARDKFGQTAMFYSGADIDALLKAGVDIDARNAAGWAALHVAAFKANADRAKALLDHGADIEAKTLAEFVIPGDEAWGSQGRTIAAGYTALDIAINEHDRVKWVTGRNRPMIDLLRARGAKRPFLGIRFLSW